RLEKCPQSGGWGSPLKRPAEFPTFCARSGLEFIQDNIILNRYCSTEANMRAQTVDVKSSTGRVLCCTVFRAGGKKLLAKGHVISDEDIRVLESEGME